MLAKQAAKLRLWLLAAMLAVALGAFGFVVLLLQKEWAGGLRSAPESLISMAVAVVSAFLGLRALEALRNWLEVLPRFLPLPEPQAEAQTRADTARRLASFTAATGELVRWATLWLRVHAGLFALGVLWVLVAFFPYLFLAFVPLTLRLLVDIAVFALLVAAPVLTAVKLALKLGLFLLGRGKRPLGELRATQFSLGLLAVVLAVGLLGTAWDFARLAAAQQALARDNFLGLELAAFPWWGAGLSLGMLLAALLLLWQAHAFLRALKAALKRPPPPAKVRRGAKRNTQRPVLWRAGIFLGLVLFFCFLLTLQRHEEAGRRD